MGVPGHQVDGGGIDKTGIHRSFKTVIGELDICTTDVHTIGTGDARLIF